MSAAVAKQVVTKTPVVSPSSSFSELLRRSRFASYDPSIAQVYSSSPAHASRGNWGLKRPISQRRRNAYITLKAYEEHAQFIEWDNAEAQVRLVKQVEELNVTPELVTNTPFTRALGASATKIWMVDSEFDQARDAEFRYEAFEKDKAQEEGEAESESVEPPSPTSDSNAWPSDAFGSSPDLASLGKRGPRGYGAHAPPTLKGALYTTPTAWNFRQPNPSAMSDAEFTKYISKLRALRPEFLAQLRARLVERHRAGALRGTSLNPDMSDMELGLANSAGADHRAFLNDYYERVYSEREEGLAEPVPGSAKGDVSEGGGALPKDFVRPQIKPQPHRFGGLSYAHPTLLDTFFTTESKPALYLSVVNAPRFSSSVTEKRVQVSFAGLVAELEGAPSSARPLFTPTSGPSAEGVKSGRLEKSVVNVRVKSLKIEELPKVVGKAREGVEGVRIRETVVQDVPLELRVRDSNTENPGSFEYVGLEPLKQSLNVVKKQQQGAKRKGAFAPSSKSAFWRGDRFGAMAKGEANPVKGEGA